jgi:hypothetical protein
MAQRLAQTTVNADHMRPSTGRPMRHQLRQQSVKDFSIPQASTTESPLALSTTSLGLLANEAAR